MNNSELDRILKSAKVPEPREGFWNDLPRRITSKLHWKPAAQAASTRTVHWFPRLAWTLTTVSICLIIGFMVGHWRGHKEAMASGGLLQDEKVIKEMLAMFPNRVRAVVQDEHGLSLVLSDAEDVPVSTPLWVKICDGKHCSAMITFSGQEIEISGRKMTVLANGRGGVILVGDGLVWSSEAKAKLAGDLDIQARALGKST